MGGWGVRARAGNSSFERGGEGGRGDAGPHPPMSEPNPPAELCNGESIGQLGVGKHENRYITPQIQEIHIHKPQMQESPFSNFARTLVSSLLMPSLKTDQL